MMGKRISLGLGNISCTSSVFFLCVFFSYFTFTNFRQNRRNPLFTPTIRRIASSSKLCKLDEPWKSKDYFLNDFSVKTLALVGIYNQQFKGTILFMVFDFQGEDGSPGWLVRTTPTQKLMNAQHCSSHTAQNSWPGEHPLGCPVGS